MAGSQIPFIPSVQPYNWGSVVDANRMTQKAVSRLASYVIGSSSAPTYSTVTLTDLTATRLVASDSGSSLVSVSDLTNWIGGTVRQIIVTDDSDGTVTLSTPQDIATDSHPTFDYINLSTSQGVTGLTVSDHPTFDYITLSTSQGVTGLTTTDHPTFDYIVLSTSQGVTGLGTGDHPTFDYISLSTSQGITGLTTSDSPTFNNLTLTGTFNGRQLNPDGDNSYDMGESDRRWQDLYLAGNLSDGSNSLTVANAKTAYDHVTSDGTDHTYIDQDLQTTASPQFTGIELGHASDTTITRVSAGIIAVEGTNVMLVGDAPTAHTHDGDTLQHDGVNSDGGAFSFTTSGTVTFSQSIASANYAATNKLTACTTNAGALDFSAASKTLTVEDDAVVSQDYSSDASPTFNSLTLSTSQGVTGLTTSDHPTFDYIALSTNQGVTGLTVSDHPTFDYITLSTSQGVTGLATSDHPTFDYIALSTSQGVTGLATSDHPTFDYIVLSTSQGITGLGTGDAPTFTNVNVSISQGITGLTTSDSPTFNNLTLTGTLNGRQINPDNDATYDLGESDRRWQDLYLSGSITLVNTITEISTDGTLGGDSDSAVPTEKAVKTYVDGAGGGGGDAFKTITGITNDVVADAADDTLTLASANARLTIVGTTATDTITFTADDDLHNYSWTSVDGTDLKTGSVTQAFGAVLDDLNTLGASTADGEFLVATGAGVLDWESGATARTSIGLGTSDNVQFAKVGAGTAATAQLHADQSSSSGAIPVLTLDQADVSEEFIHFIGTAASGVITQSIVAAGDVTTAELIGFVKIKITDVGDQVTDQAYYQSFYTLSS